MIKAEALGVDYAGRDGVRPALEEVSFTLEAGEKAALVGANGAGKSTLLLTLAGALAPDRGRLEVEGLAVGPGTVAGGRGVGRGKREKTLEKIRRQAALVFQNPDDQFFMPTVEEDAAFGPRNLRIPENVLAAKLEETLRLLGIEHLKSRPVLELSGGEKRLAALAGALVMEPRWLLLDEPTSFLDGRAKRALTALLKTLPQGMVLATHDLGLAGELCSRVLMLKAGRLFAAGPAGLLLHDEPLLEACGL